MLDLDAVFPSHLETPQPSPITDDAWSAEAIAACLPPAVLAARRGEAAGEEDGR